MAVDPGVGARLAEIRKGLQYQQQEVARKVGIVRSYLSAIEHGSVGAGPRTLEKLAAFYGVPVDYLLTGQGDPPRLVQPQTVRDPQELALLAVWRKLGPGTRHQLLALLTDVCRGRPPRP